MRIYLLRHGTAEARAVTDEARRLVERGHVQAKMVGDLFRRMDLEFDAVLASPYTRAVETARITLEAAGLDNEVEIEPGLTPMSDPVAAAAAIASREVETILAVAHEPVLSLVARTIIGGGDLVLKKAGVIELELHHRAPPRGRLLGHLRPGHLA